MPSAWRAAADRNPDRLRAAGLAAAVLALVAGTLQATSVIPISDQELYRRADLVVYGVVVASSTVENDEGRPETVTRIRPLRTWKGPLSGELVLHQPGGVLPDGRFFKLWGRPEYTPGHEVIVFAIARPEGDYQTAEMLLGKFEVERDEAGRLFAVPELARGPHPGVTVRHRFPSRGDGEKADALRDEAPSPHDLAHLLDFLDAGAGVAPAASPAPVGRLEAVVHRTESPGLTPKWGNINDSLWRWSNGATAAWTLNGTANVTGGGVAEATSALASWTNDPNSTINYTLGSGTSNVIYLNAPSSSGCGWSTCVTSSGGVIGCGGPSGGGGGNGWLGDVYSTITGGTVWLRCYATLNAFGSVTTQSILTHELGHTLGLGHSDQNFSPHDSCSGDESSAIMRSVAQNRTTLGTDDLDAIRWLYGDGGNHCSSPPAPAVSGLTPFFGPTLGNTLVTITGTGFQAGAAVTVGGLAATAVAFVGSTTLTARTPAHAAGMVNVVVTNPDSQSGTLASGYDYQDGTGFYTLTPCRVLDTRSAAGPYGAPALAANADRTFTLAGKCGIPAGAKAVSINATVTQATAAGDLRLRASGGALTSATVINYRAGQTRANNGTAALGSNGAIIVRCDQPSGVVQFIIDVNGYYQ